MPSPKQSHQIPPLQLACSHDLWLQDCCVVAMSFVMKQKQKATWLCGRDEATVVVIVITKWQWSCDHDSGCGLAIATVVVDLRSRSNSGCCAIAMWTCGGVCDAIVMNAERTLSVTILAGTKDFPPELRGCSNHAHITVVHILECAHISVLPLYVTDN